ncbi:fibroblast growth factor receptor 2-like isoform X2 [Ptychodera flava]|uniref:fibroblast growth factor receptor 2-like isoform X2 n=1 Tax=Ptychodera flava TaxID=63121 RepID=UPI00396A006A
MKSTHNQWTTSVSKLVPLLLSIVINVSQPVLSGVTWKMEPKNTTVRVGEEVTLYCAVKTDGNDIHLPEWYKMTADGTDDDPITDSGTSYNDCCIVTGNRTNGEVNLVFRSVRIEDEGTWICRSPRTVNDQARYAQLTVLEIPEPTEKQKTIWETKKRTSVALQTIWDEVPSHTIAREGQPTTLHCKVNNYSGHVLPEWYKRKEDGTLLHISSGGASYHPGLHVNRSLVGQADLVINNVNKTDEGTWICRIPDSTIDERIRQVSANLTVLDDDPHCVKVSGVGPNGEVIIGSTVELQCSIESRAMEYGNLVWTRNGIDMDRRFLNPILFSKTIKFKDDGIRMNCRFNHSTFDFPWTCNESIVFHVQDPPTADHKEISLCIRKGETLNLTCPYTEGTPPVENITWEVDGKGHDVNRLVVENIGRQVSSPIKYTCTATSENFNGLVIRVRVKFIVHVQYEPMVSISHGSEIQVDEGDDLAVDCFVDSNPPSLVTWIRPDGVQVPGRKLVIDVVHRTDHGIYNCSAVNSMCTEEEYLGTAYGLTRVLVMYPPTALNKIQNSKSAADQGEVATLMCEIDSYPTSSIQWFRLNGGALEQNSDIFRENEVLGNSIVVSKLMINNTDPGRDYGVYVCISRNEKGTLAFNVTLQGKSEPDPVVNIHFNVSENTVFVTWTPGFDGGHMQNFLIEYWETPDGNKQRTLYINESMYTIEHLEQDTNYEIQIISVNELGNSSSVIFAFQTPAVFTSDEQIKQDYTTPVIVSVVVFVLVSTVTVIILFILKRKIFKRKNDYEEVKANDAPVQANGHHACPEEIPMNEIHDYDDAATLDVFNSEETPRVENTRAEYASSSLCVSLVTPMVNTNREYAQPDVIPEDPYMKCGEHVFEVNSNQTCLKKILHSGKFYDIYKADAWFVAGQDGVTSVVIKTPKDVADKNSDASLRSEIETMKSIPPNGHLVKLLATCTKGGNLTYLIMEFANYGNLKTFLVYNRERITSVTDHHKQFLSFAIDVAKGMKYLAEQKILHRCLSGKHVLVFHKQGIAKMIGKISNFGYASSITNPGRYQEMERKPDYRWTASEVLMNEEFSLASEVWSYGILLWEIYTIGRVPYEAFTEHELMEEFIKGRRLVSPEKCPDNVFNLMLACWKSKPWSRPTMIDVVQDLDVIK